MIVTEKKPFEEVLGALKNSKKIFIMGCGECATTCKTGGEKEAIEMKSLLEKNGKIITGWTIPDAPCVASQVVLHMAKHRKAIDSSDAILVLACGLGGQSVLENDIARHPVYIGCNTMFGCIVDKKGLIFSERCAMCGDCILNVTGTICPVTRCAKGLLNGPCGGSNKGKCEVDKNKDCAWILIYNRLKELDMLEKMRSIRPAKDYSKINRPREIIVH